jgi:predicted dehydrogenase
MAQRRLRIGVVSAAHLHTRGLVAAALACREAEVVGLAEPDDELRAYFAAQFPSLAVFATADEFYERARPEAIITGATNQDALMVVTEAAGRGVHVMKEKPMAANLALAEQMATAAARHGVRLMVNWPTNWQPALHEAKRRIDASEIGAVWQVHHRAGHGGPPADYPTRGPVARVGWGWLIDRAANGGGALIDFCSYGAVLSRWIMGQPSRVVGLGGRYAKDFFTVEDNAILVLGYPHGHAVCEGTWTQPAAAVPTPLTVYGTDGSIAVTGPGQLIIATRSPDGSPAVPRVVECPPLPETARSGPAYFVHQILTGEPFAGLVSAELSRDAQEILDAGIRAIATGQEVGLPLKAYLL